MCVGKWNGRGIMRQLQNQCMNVRDIEDVAIGGEINSNKRYPDTMEGCGCCDVLALDSLRVPRGIDVKGKCERIELDDDGDENEGRDRV